MKLSLSHFERLQTVMLVPLAQLMV